ncbi:sulfotransferase [uncultured Desulfosarcina sp.]|uniref:sulfotransferase family protein n=1 Tax=uncultured Desulfosarcina sp. TaxID=218289 RepID=UPI0029C82151|nr:sulfotransferase [uncultured Desulfosarcina sp.]
MGRGHSGSTMLDAMLGNAPDVESVGELVAGMGRYDDLCSCGETFNNCHFWKDVRLRYEAAAGVPWGRAVQDFMQQAHLKYFLKTLTAIPSDDWVQRFRKDCEYLAKAIGSTDKNIVVDSSKEVTRALFLLRFIPDTKVIQLVRHPVNVLQSHYSRLKKGGGFKFLRYRFTPKRWYGPFLFLSAIGWLVGNLFAEVVRCHGRKRSLRVRYEDLIAFPERELARIEEFIDVSLEIVKKKVRLKKSFNVGHNIGGNHMRMAGTFRFDPKKAKRKRLPRYYDVMVNIICWPLLWYYGYYGK